MCERGGFTGLGAAPLVALRALFIELGDDDGAERGDDDGGEGGGGGGGGARGDLAAFGGPCRVVELLGALGGTIKNELRGRYRFPDPYILEQRYTRGEVGGQALAEGAEQGSALECAYVSRCGTRPSAQNVLRFVWHKHSLCHSITHTQSRMSDRTRPIVRAARLSLSHAARSAWARRAASRPPPPEHDRRERDDEEDGARGWLPLARRALFSLLATRRRRVSSTTTRRFLARDPRRAPTRRPDERREAPPSAARSPSLSHAALAHA